ncbi:23S rRNA (guanosine(2251)-2'-O)-methyltransferase RlmB [Nonlabens spongiae]|uniref:23S rRNA (Guanosine(2251)-2'-O)-methyltransferase RlmB n=1 Tax=Nonlabens spongiae TaxID=331648 RepID=A0A1W6MKJ2_9FLAO|nr:23S rRNA (guanosine(2251)-2'-O)-methyltransferase RlmB [Nonlabens spongiae]ARN77999.1 23S rRNA (guanosine(2251)-2'-O)-methyltransferase RlmB [Nonlabens spongiae]
MKAPQNIFGIRAIIEAIEADKEIAKVYLLKTGDGVLFQELKKLCTARNIATSFVPVEKLDHMANGNHQGAVATISPVSFHDLEELLESLDPDDKNVILLLDGVTDVRNFGAILRTAECTGVKAVVIPENGSAPVNAATIKTSAGAAFNITICKVNHIKDAVYVLQSYGIATAAADEKAEKLVYETNLNKSIAIIMGSEERGVNPSTLKVVDHHFKLPIRGSIASLNVSVACGAILYEVVRQQTYS